MILINITSLGYSGLKGKEGCEAHKVIFEAKYINLETGEVPL